MSKISVFGLGYVGAVSAACFANEGHTVVGVDPNETKVDMINDGKSPIIEQGLAELIQNVVADNRLRATKNPEEGILATELSLVCVGTPSRSNGSLDLKYVSQVCEQIGKLLKRKTDFHVVVCRSTMLPGSMSEVVIPTLEKFSNKRAGVDFGVCSNPEFLREGTAVYDFYHPPKTVIGQIDSRSGDLVADLYKDIEDAPLIRTEIETAEMIKYADNVWHAVKIGFANEIGNICKILGIDGHKVMDIFCRDTKLNLSPYYLKPGFAFGGSCLPKDVRALVYKSRTLDLELPLLNAILYSNERQIQQGLRMIISKGNKKVGILGLSFKAGTDDLRESPMVELVEHLLGKGYDLCIYDRNVNLAKLMGANREYIFDHIPHIARLMVKNVDHVLEHAQTIVVGNNSSEFKAIMNRLKNGQIVVDLARITDRRSEQGKYDGICW